MGFVKVLATILIVLPAQGGEHEPWWWDGVDTTRHEESQARLLQAGRMIVANLAELEAVLNEAPAEGLVSQVVLSLPLPNGGSADFLINASPIMAPALAARYPQIRTWLGRGLSNPTETLRCDLSPAGFRAMVLGSRGSWFMDPLAREDVTRYVSYYRRDVQRPWGLDSWCHTELDFESDLEPNTQRTLVEGELRVYRTAIACTGEYTDFHGGIAVTALMAVVSTLNRVNAIFEREAAIRLELVSGVEQLIFTDPGSDPYTNNNLLAMLNENQATLDSVIGNANYDLGHVFGTHGGGVALVGSPCTPGLKAQGVSSSMQPTGDPFDVDLVAHEMGHQLGANHTFNGTSAFCGGNRTASSAFEPGSGSTVMSYAGICDEENLQDHSDPYMHTRSFEQIIDFTHSAPGNCAEIISVVNSAPQVDAGGDYIIPQNTPFTLTGSAQDPDLDAMTWCWEQFDLGAASPPMEDNGDRPLFRSFPPTDQAWRTFPQLSDILNNTQTLGETPAVTDRILNFRLTVRDNHPGGGGVAFDEAQVQVVTTSGPFQITHPNTAVTWTGGDLETVTWDPAGTETAPVDCAWVDLMISLNGGLNFPILLEAAVPNNGTAIIEVPNMGTTQARLKIACADNIFFDISNASFTLESVPLICTRAWRNWLKESGITYEDPNSNGVVDVADLVFCLFMER